MVYNILFSTTNHAVGRTRNEVAVWPDVSSLAFTMTEISGGPTWFEIVGWFRAARLLGTSMPPYGRRRRLKAKMPFTS
jgi:hypothetical protein